MGIRQFILAMEGIQALGDIERFRRSVAMQADVQFPFNLFAVRIGNFLAIH